MEKLTLQFGVFCLLFWSCIALKYTGECKINRNESINGIKIDLDSKFFLCTGMFYENIPQKLKPYLKRVIQSIFLKKKINFSLIVVNGQKLKNFSLLGRYRYKFNKFAIASHSI